MTFLLFFVRREDVWAIKKPPVMISVNSALDRENSQKYKEEMANEVKVIA